MVTGLACAGRRVAWPGEGTWSCPVVGGTMLARQAMLPAMTGKGGPKKMRGAQDMCPQPVPRSSCGTTAMQGVDVMCIFCSCAVACLVSRESLQIYGSQFVMLYRCVQTRPGHRDLLKLIFQRRGWEGRCAVEESEPCLPCCPRLASAALSGSLCCF